MDTFLSRQIIACALEVHHTLGVGFLESVYQTALVHELRIVGLKAEMECKIDVFYKTQKVGIYYADILVEDHFILEIKCALKIINEHMFQVKNYLRSTGLRDALIFNFRPKTLEFRRVFPG